LFSIENSCGFVLEKCTDYLCVPKRNKTVIDRGVWFNFHSQQRNTDIYPMKRKTRLTAVYYNNWKQNLFRINVDVKLRDPKHQLDQLNGRLNCRNARRVVGVEYRRSPVGLD
jgi:predicted alpha-1,6-mannanase (GH76 family)